MTSGRELVWWALGQRGKPYVWGATGPGSFDCSGLVWADLDHYGNREHRKYRTAASLFGWCQDKGTLISVDRARSIPGALLFTRKGKSYVHHVAFSLGGNDSTMEAANPRIDCGVFKIGNRFDYAGLIPGIDYSGTSPAGPPVPVPAPTPTPAPNTNVATSDFQRLAFALKVCPGGTTSIGANNDCVRLIQQELASRGYWIKVDGDFGNVTKAFVIKFQRDRGLKPDGVVGPRTWAALLAPH